ncbi:ABC transporter permease [Bacteroides timonensis]|uniref:ABC transporter permease n=1 Tax=Bacteroides timonensis TaxID=1470345 RepID=UPI0004B51579|nr:ABC transporter permease [Bacteroides timonensis]
MLRIYLKQAWSLLKENPLISGLSIAGTALAITAVMMIILVVQVRLAEYAPESGRGRMLHITATRAFMKSNEGNWNNGGMGKRVVRELFYNLKTPKEVSGYARKTVSVSSVAKRTFTKYRATYTDDRFWNIFNFTFLDGTPFTYEDNESGIRKAVISEKLARRLFGKTEARGQQLLINRTEYTICGVVKNVPRTARYAYSDVWLPYNSSAGMETPANVYEGMVGPFSVVMLAHSTDDFTAIRAEVEKVTKQLNANTSEYGVSFFNGPMSNLDMVVTSNNGFIDEIPYGNWFLRQGSFIFFLLLLPALNMVSITLTNFRKRRGEIGVRKAFGATTGNIFRQVVDENLIITFIGGVFGLLLSIGVLLLTRDIFFPSGTQFNSDMLIRPETFLITLVFIFLLNLLCAGIPAWRAGKYNIVKSLNNQE